MKNFRNVTLVIIGIACIALLIWNESWPKGVAFFVLLFETAYLAFWGKVKKAENTTHPKKKRVNVKEFFSDESFFWPMLLFFFGLFLLLGDLVFKIPKFVEGGAWMVGVGFTAVGLWAIIAWIRTAILTAIRFLRFRAFFM